MKKILIVEDDNILAKAFTIALKDAGFDTMVAIDGEEALEKVRNFKPDLILLDLIIPIKSGEDVLAEIKRDDELKNIPVLVSTVKSDTDSIGRCAALGMRGYFIKAHYTLDDIIKEVKKVLGE
ncbi:MAG: PAS/PAC sensor hybrid histidine kinase [uncultured bacterium]|nr:MAG: PAS/PAC sensor hybrid histidine kinase [uncultured bacterium]